MKNIIIMCVVIIGLSYLNASELSNYIKNDTDMSVYFPKSQVSKGKVSYGIDGLRIEETFEIKLEKNENGNVTMNKTGYNLDGKLASKTIFHFDKTLRTLKNYVQIFNIEIIKKIKWDTLIAEISGDNRNFTINNYKQGAKVNASRSLVLDNNTVYMDTIKVFLLGCLNKGIRNFNADLIVDSQNIKIPVEFELVRTKNLLTLSPEYKDVPDFFVKNSVSDEEFFVYIFKFSGIAWAFYPYRFYVAYKKDPSYKYAAYWGEDPKNAVFEMIEK